MHYSGESAFTIEELYLLCAKFIKEKEGKAFHLSYQDRLQLSAHCKQVAHGPYQPNASPGVGWLDVVGSDRKATWQSLGDLSRERAQEKFVEILDRACPLLGPYLEAHLNERRAERERILREEAEEKAREAERQRRLEEEQLEMQRQQQQRRLAEAAAAAEQAKLDEMKKLPLAGKEDSVATQTRRYLQEAQIRAALNQQTSAQFSQYAAEQHPGDAEKQKELIQQLQEQHFHQYMTQVYQQQLRHQEQLTREAAASDGSAAAAATVLAPSGDELPPADSAEPGAPADDDADQLAPELLPASMWTRQNVSEFKKEILRDSRHCCIKIGSLATATVRVPTHEEGACIVWEFATDHYDIGFGVYFEWTISPSDRVTVHISESSDEEDDEEEQAEGGADGETTGAAGTAGGPNGIGGSRRPKDAEDKAVDEVIPVYRRDCQQEVYCGSHQYPGRGVYLLKFDNSYSLWRSKWLYYRVYYTK